MRLLLLLLLLALTIALPPGRTEAASEVVETVSFRRFEPALNTITAGEPSSSAGLWSYIPLLSTLEGGSLLQERSFSPTFWDSKPPGATLLLLGR
jgi:hypothetical protein